MAAEPVRKIPWLIIIAGLFLSALLAYALFAGWIPAKHRMVRLESEMKEVYAREAVLQSKLAQQELRSMVREQELIALRSERDALARRIEDLERELAAARARRR